jgi:menaquinone-dependent protoporphyrinogen IX oxidase
MKVTIIHDSRFGNGRRIAETIADALRAADAEVRVGNTHELKPNDVARDAPDLLVVGTAVRMFQLSGATKRWLRALRRALHSSRGSIARAATFMTYGMPDSATTRFGERLRRSVARVREISAVYPEVFRGRVSDTEGPLVEGTIDRARGHAEQLRSWIADAHA